VDRVHAIWVRLHGDARNRVKFACRERGALSMGVALG
jgi:hypothetical protein